jgi:hypothetical protein
MFDSTLDSKQCSVVRHARESGCGFLCRIILLTEEMEDWAGQSFRFSEAFWGIPPATVIPGIIGLARNSPQNTSVKELRGKNPPNKGLR